MSLQDIVSGAKKFSSKSLNLEYWIYDVIEDGPYSERLAHLREWYNAAYLDSLEDERDSPGPAFCDTLVLVETAFMASAKATQELHIENLDNGFEGTIVRSATGQYKRGNRSADLLKVKNFEDAEFEIIGCKDGKGKEEGLAIWRCKALNGLEFDVRPKGTVDQRREMFVYKHEYIGKDLTVRYANLTPDGIPFHPVGLAVRDYE